MIKKIKKLALMVALSTVTFSGSFAATSNDSLKDKAVDKAHQAKEKATELKDKAVDKARELKDKAADKMHDIAGQKIAPIEVVEAWARPSTSATSAVYMNITNPSTKDLTLVNATALDVANKVEIHQTATETGGLVKMVHIDKLVIPAGKTVELRPNGLHIMLMDLKSPLNVGDKFKVTLKFDDASTQVIEVEVKDKTM
jgi:copper(I)-binding protein